MYKNRIFYLNRQLMNFLSKPFSLLIFFCIIVSLCMVESASATSIQLSGFVRDGQTNEVLIGANVLEINQNSGTATDNRGYFSLKVNSPSVLKVSYIGYATRLININASSDSLLVIRLNSGTNLSEITVVGQHENKSEITRLTAKELMLVPTIGGKPDVMKALQLLPGVLSQSEGMSMMMVRGGDPGQNQYLLDNVPLIYVNHLGGFLSVFNPDMINSVDFYKGNFPARHGGKLSSIVDITQREGDVSKHQGSFSLGVTDMSFSLEGPLANKKMSYIVTARKTLVDLFLAGMSLAVAENDYIVSYGFYDINAKLNWKPNDKNSLSLNLYQGDDFLNFWSKPWKMKDNESNHSSQKWGNWLVSGRWNRVFSSRLYAENIVSYCRYRNMSAQQSEYMQEETLKASEYENRSSVADFSLRSAWKYSLHKNWDLNFGAQASFLGYEPNYIYNSGAPTPYVADKFSSFESAVYLDNTIRLGKSLQLQPALRYSLYANDGALFPSFEPRVNVTFQASPLHSFNLNYMRVSQTSHLVFARDLILKKEIWLPATQFIPPQTSNQLSATWNASFRKGDYSTETSIYYKKMEHLAALKEGYENMYGITGIENKLETNGTGIAYGAEFTLHKNTGKWKGSVSYAWQHATRQFANINGGKVYEFDYNRPHSFIINANRQLKNNWTMNVVWQLQSGLPYSPVLGKQYVLNPENGQQNFIGFIYGSKNSDRMVSYQRLDLGFNHTITTKRGNKAVWTYSIYNAYAHINPYIYYYDDDYLRRNGVRYDRPLQLHKLSLFGLIPSIAYKLYFDFDKKPITKTKETKPKKKYNWLYME